MGQFMCNYIKFIILRTAKLDKIIKNIVSPILNTKHNSLNYICIKRILD